MDEEHATPEQAGPQPEREKAPKKKKKQRQRGAPPVASGPPEPIKKRAFKRELHELWIELVQLQKDVIAAKRRVLIVLEGRDAAGKDGAIKVFTRHLSPRETRVVALSKPNERERASWHFQRWTQQLPVDGEIVLLNRSWYNRAGVERVMGFCSEAEAEAFLDQAPRFEEMLVRSGMSVLKYYLDLSREEQERRMQERRENPLKQWKISPIDAVALDHYDDYTKARDRMLARTHSEHAPWTIVRADDKRHAQLALIRHVLQTLEYPSRGAELSGPDARVAFPWSPDCASDGRLAR
jgi:polyphosphate kinase 2